MRRASLWGLLFLLLLLARAALAEGVRPSAVHPLGRPQLAIIANLYDNDRSNLVILRIPSRLSPKPRPLRPTPEELPTNWNLSEVRVSPDGQTRAVSGYEMLVVSAGIRMWGPAETWWRQVSFSCLDGGLSLTNTDLCYYTCWGDNPGLMRAPIAGGDAVPVYAGGYRLQWAQVNSVSGSFAEVETSDAGSTILQRIKVIDAEGNVTTYPWTENGISDLRWSPAGDEVMYVGTLWGLRDSPLYRMTLDGTVELVEPAVDNFAYLPDGGYAYARTICPEVQDFDDPRCYRRSELTIVRDTGRGTFCVRGNLFRMDAYLR
jgi:dipeptidyl aminopeptidase/acylaminoacyl peptidase